MIQGDADTDLADYPDDAFDYVILSQTLQATRHPRVVLEHMLRIGRHAMVSFPNFGHWRVRLPLLFAGRMPHTDMLPYSWYDTPNIHHCTIKDFLQLCEEIGVKMEKAVALNAWGSPLRLNAPWWFWNLFGEQAVFPAEPQGLTPRQGPGGGRRMQARHIIALQLNLAHRATTCHFRIFRSRYNCINFKQYKYYISCKELYNV